MSSPSTEPQTVGTVVVDHAGYRRAVTRVALRSLLHALIFTPTCTTLDFERGHGFELLVPAPAGCVLFSRTWPMGVVPIVITWVVLFSRRKPSTLAFTSVITDRRVAIEVKPR